MLVLILVRLNELYLDFANFDHPTAYMFSGSFQNATTMIISLSQNRCQVLNTRIDADTSFATQAGRFGAWIQSGVVAFANFFDSNFELVTLVEGDENRFLDIVTLELRAKITWVICFDECHYRDWIFQRLGQRYHAQVDITTTLTVGSK